MYRLLGSRVRPRTRLRRYKLIGKGGAAVVKLWDFVDDFIIYGPTYEKTSQALAKLLHLAMDCGMLCHPTKLTPLQQIVKYCGFLLDLVEFPCLRVPVSKRERALAIVDHLLESASTREFSSLSLAVAAGVLQSLVEATPLRLEPTYFKGFIH